MSAIGYSRLRRAFRGYDIAKRTKTSWMAVESVMRSLSRDRH